MSYHYHYSRYEREHLHRYVDNSPGRGQLQLDLQQKRSQHGTSWVDRQKHMSAVLTPSGFVLATGYNHYRKNKYAPSVHAEAHAISNAVSTYCRKNGVSPAELMKSPPSVDLMVVRDDGHNSRPCSACIQHITSTPYLNIQKVYYSTHLATGGLVMETKTDLLANCDEHVSHGNLEDAGCEEDDEDPFKPRTF